MKRGIIILVIITVIIILSFGYVKIYKTGNIGNEVNKTEDNMNKTLDVTNITILYKFPYVNTSSYNLSNKYNYLQSLKPIPTVFSSFEAQKIATSIKKLSKDEFELIINDLIGNEYINYMAGNSGIYIKYRKIEEDDSRIQIKDNGEKIVYNDVPYEKPGSWNNNITLNYIYYNPTLTVGSTFLFFNDYL